MYNQLEIEHAETRQRVLHPMPGGDSMEKNYRHEFKYLISKNAADLLRMRLPHFMQRDSHAGPTGQYTIRSLYFDDPDYHAFYEKVSGIDNRTKYRIRCYNYNASVFKLECKEKKGNLTRKTGQAITLADALALQEGTLEPCPDTKEGMAEHLRMLRRTTGTRPAVLVDYDRTPFVCHSGNTRITLDENLRTNPYCTDILGPITTMIPVLEPDQVILEVKFDDFLPGYLCDVLADIPKIPMAISKFAMCLDLF